MPEKQLTESAWKVFAKGKTYKDDALLKALLALAKSEKSSPADQLEALDAVEKQVEVLRKANKADKALSSQLDDMDSALGRQRKAAELAVKTLAQAQAKEKAQAGQGGDEEDETPALLTAKMIPLLRELRKGEVRMNAMVCTSGKNTAVLIMRRPIAVTKRKLLADAADAKGGAKYAVGECVYEEGVLTFIMQSGAKGLAKRIRMALLEQTKMRLKVRVRGDDGEDEDAELEEDEGADAHAQGEGNTDTTADGAIPQAPPMATSAAEQAYTQRLNLLKKRIAQALQAQHPEATKIRTLLGFAKDKAEQQKDFVAAGKSLDVLEKLLDATPPVAQPQGNNTTGNTTGNDKTSEGDEAQAKAQTAAFTARLTALMQAVKDAVAQGHPQAAVIRAKVAEAGAAARQRDFPAAGALLDDVERLLSSNASVQPEPQQNTQPNTQPDTQTELSEKDVRERVNSLGLQLRELAKHPDFERLRARFTAAANALRSKDLAQASALLDEIDPDITKALSQARGQSTSAEGPSLRQMAQAALAWRQACAIATTEIAAIQAGVIAELEAEDELSADEIDAVRTELDRLNGVLTTISPQLGDLIDTAVNLTADKRAPVLVKLMDMAERAQDDIGSSQMIEAARNNGVHDVDLAAPALAALNTLREAIGPLLAA